MGYRRKTRTGQSIVEYLIIATVIILAILGIRGRVSNNMNTLFNNAASQTANAGTALGNLRVE